MCVVSSVKVHSHCSASLQNSFHLAKLKLDYSLSNNSPFFPPPVPGNHPSTFCPYEFYYSRYFA